MTFTTLTYVLFLAMVFSLYWLLRRRRAQNVLLVLASYTFYAWWDWRFCSLMLASSVIDYAVGLALPRTTGKRPRRLLLAVSLAVNLGLLGFFKYFNFFAGSFAELLDAFGMRAGDVTLRVVLPVGISFYTFQTLSYTLDIYRKQLQPTRSFVDFLAFVSFFPQLVAGPIERAARLLPQFAQPRRFDYDAAVDGSRQVLWGFFKKMAIADRLAPLVDRVYADPSAASGPELGVATFLFAFQIYADFSAYSDIAIGTARLFGFRLMRNFAYPYFAQSVGEFWRRWHISLSTWFRDYVYIPLGGNRRGPGRHVANVMVTFMVSGLWHGANWTFLAWGAIHGLALLGERKLLGDRPAVAMDQPGGPGWWPRPRVAARMLGTFAVVLLAWVFFRAASVAEAGLILSKFVTDVPNGPGWRAAGALANEGSTALGLIGLLWITEWVRRGHAHPIVVAGWPEAAKWALYTVLIWATLMLGATGGGDFIYFQF